MKIENDPDLKKQEKILDHHPHVGMPQHGTLRKAPKHMMKLVHVPGKKREREY